MDSTSAVLGHAPQVEKNAFSAANTLPFASDNIPLPVLRTATPSTCSIWLPSEVIQKIITYLPIDRMPTAILVSKEWREPMREVPRLLEKLQEIQNAGHYGSVNAEHFGHLLAQVDLLPSRCVIVGLLQLATFQPYLVPNDWSKIFITLLQRTPSLPLDECRRMLCMLALHLPDHLPGDGETQPPGTVTIFGAVDMLIAAAQPLPLETQGLVLAALCGKIDAVSEGRSRLYRKVTDIAAKWPKQVVDGEEELGFARAIYKIAVSGAADFQIRDQLRQFTFYMPFMSQRPPSGNQLTDVEHILRRVPMIMRMDLSAPERLALLQHWDSNCKPWLLTAWSDGNVKDGLRYIEAMGALDLSAHHLSDLLASCGPDGSPLLNTLLLRVAIMHGTETDSQTNYDGYFRTVDSIQAYIDIIAASPKLAMPEKVMLLRARMKGFSWRKARIRNSSSASARLPAFALGTDGDTPFYGLSAIDSLLHNKLARILEAYMSAILRSPLTDKEKFGVLRLDHPNRHHLKDMRKASEAYRNKIHFSKLPPAMKDILLNDLPGSYGYCMVQ